MTVKSPAEFLVGCADEDNVDVRLAQLGARAQAAELIEKPWRFFLRESGKDWASAPIVYRCQAESYGELQRCLDRARRLWGAQRLRWGSEVWEFGDLDWGEFGSLTNTAAVKRERTHNEREELLAMEAKVGEPRGDISELVLAIVAEQTGYKLEELHLKDDWQSDLCIDSLKLAAIFTVLWERLGWGSLDDIDLSSYPTIGHLVVYLEAKCRSASDFGTMPAVRELSELSFEPTIAPIGEVGICNERLDRESLQSIASQLGVPVEQLRLRDTEGWYHLRRRSYIVTTKSQPLWARKVTIEGGLPRLGEPYLEPIEVMSWLKYRMGDRDNAWYYAIGALMAKFLEQVDVVQPSSLGPKIFLSNHQTALEGYLFPLLAPIVTGLSLQGVAMKDHGVDWADDISEFMFSHDYFPRHLLGTKRGFTFGDTLGLLRLLPGIERDMATREWGLHIVASGQREWIARHRLTEVSSMWLEMAIRLQIPIVPVRFKGGLPLEDVGSAQDFPWGMGRQSVSFGSEISAEELASWRGKTRKLRVLQALNDFDLGHERPSEPDGAFAEMWRDWSQFYGGEAVATLIFCCLLRFIDVNEELEHRESEFPCALLAFLTAALGQRAWKERCTLMLPDNPDGRWVAELARRVFAQRGPQVCVAGERCRVLRGTFA